MELNYTVIIGQIFGIAGMLMTIFSMQCRSNQNFFRCQTAGGVLFTLSFILFGAWTGALMNVFSVIRPELLRREKIAASKWTLPGLLTLLLIISLILVFVFEEKILMVSIIFIAQTAGTCTMATQNGKIIRLGQLYVVSPLWLTYNLLMPVPTIGGIITETFNIISVLTALFRYRKIGFTQK